MEIRLPVCTLREWKLSDADALVYHADNRKIWLNLRDAFPSPYTAKDAQAWLQSCQQGSRPPTQCAIVVNDQAVGGIGVNIQTDVNRKSAELGYWLGEEYWGRGIMPAAVGAFTAYAFASFDLTRIFAVVFDHNRASMRVLEKAGFVCEGRLHASAFKNGKIIDQLLYARVRV